MASLGSLIVKLAADTSDFKKGFDDARKTAGGFESVIGDLGGKVGKFLTVVGAGVALGAFTKQLFDATVEAGKQAEQMEQLASRTGIAAQSLEGMSVALGRVGMSHHGLAMGMQLLSRNMIEARNGSEEAKSSFERMGIELANAGTNEEVLRKIADQFAVMPDGAEKTALAMKLFGRAGADLIPILNQGSAGLDKARQKASEFGLILTDTERGALTQFDDKMDDLKSATMGFGTQIGVTMAPAFATMVDWVTKSVAKLTQFIELIRDPSMAKFADLMLRAAGQGDLLDRGVKEPKKLLDVGPMPADVLDSLEMDKKFRTPEQVTSARGSQIVTDTQKALYVQDRLNTSYEVAEGLVKGVSITALDGVVARGRAEEALGRTQLQIIDREQKERNDAFGVQLAQAEHLQQLAEGRDKAFKPGKFMQMDFNDNAPLAGGTEAGGQIANITEGWRVATDAIDGFNNSQALMTEDLTKNAQYAKADAAIAAARYQADSGFFRDSSTARAATIHQIETQRDLEIQLEKVRNGGHISFARMTELESAAQAQMIQTAQQFPTVWDSALKSIEQASSFIWGNIVSQFSSSIATMIVKGGDLRQFFESAQIMILQSFIATGIQMTAAWIIEQGKRMAASVVSNTEGTAAHTAMEAAKTEATVAGETARAAAAMATGKAIGVSMLGQLSAIGALAAGMISLMGFVVGNVVAMMGAIASALIAGIVTAPEGAIVAGAAIGLAIAGGAAVTAGLAAVAAGTTAAGTAISASLLTPMAAGGIVTGPTPALVGEAGPEAIIPLSQLGNMGGPTVIENHLYLNGRELAFELSDELISTRRLRYGV